MRISQIVHLPGKCTFCEIGESMAKGKPTVEEQLCKVTQVRREEGEMRESYMKRLVGATDTMGDALWENLSDSAVTWVNRAIVALEMDEPLPDFPDE